MRSQIVFGAAIDRSAILHAAVAVAGFLSARSWTVTLTDVGERFTDGVDAIGHRGIQFGWMQRGAGTALVLKRKKEQRVKKE